MMIKSEPLFDEPSTEDMLQKIIDNAVNQLNEQQRKRLEDAASEAYKAKESLLDDLEDDLEWVTEHPVKPLDPIEDNE